MSMQVVEELYEELAPCFQKQRYTKMTMSTNAPRNIPTYAYSALMPNFYLPVVKVPCLYV